MGTQLPCLCRCLRVILRQQVLERLVYETVHAGWTTRPHLLQDVIVAFEQIVQDHAVTELPLFDSVKLLNTICQLFFLFLSFMLA